MNRQELSAASPTERAESPPGTLPLFYEWKPSSGAPVIRLSYDLVDELNFQAMKGFGAIPRRGAEVGGILIGQVDERARTVTLTGYQPIECKHARGPSYILESDELENLATALARLEPAEEGGERAAGFFRSNTRETLDLAEEDRALLERFFPGELSICLMVRPFATRVSEGIFFFKRGGAWTADGPETVFPFRRKELGGGKRPRRTATESEPPPAASRASSPPTTEVMETELPPVSRPLIPILPREARPTRTSAASERIPIPDLPEFGEDQPAKMRGTWVWIPLSFVFLLLGIVLGFQIAMSFTTGKGPQENAADPYGLELSVTEADGSLHLKWNASLPAFRNASKGHLSIQDGDNTKTVEITREDIERGGILYRRATPVVRFRLEIPQGERSAVSESVDYGRTEDQRRGVD
ncbi:MAG: hypothetical protein HXY18_04750 [Bryobacteraceae bacterium]|nr:hypothetical protein [Bryobacteraceae bacterium]